MAKKKKTAKKIKQRPIATSSKPNYNLAIPIFVLLAIFILFFPSLSYDFVNWDDDVNVYDNPNLTAFNWENIKGIFSSTVIGNYNPLTIFTFALEKHFFDLNPFVFHLNNLLLHLLASFLVFVFARQLGLNIYWAGLVMLLFGIHPMRIESVVWITERKDVLFTVFYLAALINYYKYKTTSPVKNKYLYWVILFFILSLFSKIQAVALPLSIVGLDYLLGGKITAKLFTDKWYLFLMSLAVGILGIYLLGETDSLDNTTKFGLHNRIFVGAYSFIIYIIKFIYPYFLSPLYPYPQELDLTFYLSIIPGLAYVYALYWAHKNGKRKVLFGLWFFLCNVVFMLQILSAGQGFLADRFTYVPYIGLWLTLAFLAQEFLQSRTNLKTMFFGGVLIYALVLGFITRKKMAIWSNGYVMWSFVIDHFPNTPPPYGNRGYWLRENGRPQEAIVDYNKGISMQPDKANLYNSRGRSYFEVGNQQQALKDYGEAIRLKIEEVELAKASSKNVEKLNAHLAEYYCNRAAAYGASNQLQLSMDDINKAIAINPDYDNIYFNRSLIYAQLGQIDNFQKDIEWLLNVHPDRADLWFESGTNQVRRNQKETALKHMNYAIQLDNSKGIYYLERSKLLHQFGRKQEGIQDAQRAQQLGAQVPPTLLR